MGKSIYEEKPWLRHYPENIPADFEITFKSVAEAFDEATEKWKKKTAIIFYGEKISYQELRERVDRFATALHELGIRKGDRVAILMLNCPEFVIAFHALSKMGAVVSPISPVYVPLEIKHQLEDVGADTIICQDIFYGGVEKSGIKIKNVILASISDSLPSAESVSERGVLRGPVQGLKPPPDDIYQKEGFYRFKDLLKKYLPNPPKVEIDPEDLLAIIYTGGTSGKPKGVTATHRNLLVHERSERLYRPMLEDGKEVQPGYMPFYHRGGIVISLVGGILRGYTIVIITNPDLDLILDYTIKYKISFFAGAPAVYEMLQTHPKTDEIDWKSLKFVGTGTDLIHATTVEKWKARTGVTLQDNYGSSEVGFSHASLMGKEKLGSIGLPICGVTAAILDPDKDEFLPVGETGEVAVASQGVTEGYWKNPEATQECEAYINGIRWWRTGDMGKMDEDGYFYLYDRKSDLIKYKGLRIHARDVEEVLRTHPKINAAGVIGVPDVMVGERVKAFVVLEPDARGKISGEEIIEYCKDKLAHYKIPQIVEFREVLPLTQVGKLSRRQLREEG